MGPHDLPLRVLMSLCSTHLTVLELAFVIDSIWQKWWCVSCDTRLCTTLPLLPCFLGSLTIHSSMPTERFVWQWTEWGLWQQPALICQPWKWDILEVDPPAPVKSSDDCFPGQHHAYNLIKDLDPDHLAKPHLDSWLTETLRDNKYIQQVLE